VDGSQHGARQLAKRHAFSYVCSRRRVWLPLLALLALVSGPRQAWSSCKVQAFEIPVRMVGPRPTTTVGLNGTEVPLLVDSGAFFSVLTEATASQLNLRLRRLPDGWRIGGHTGRLHARLTRVSKVDFNGVEIPNIEFIVGVNELGAGIMGVLGRNFLSMADTEYDLARGVVRLMFPKGECQNFDFAYWAGNAPVNVVPLSIAEREDTAIRVSTRINGVEVSAVMDTGASMTTISLRAARRAGINEADMVAAGRTGGAGAGHAQSWLAPVASFELGGEKITNNRLAIDDAGGTDYEMLLGIDYFLSHRIYVSRLQGRLYSTWNGGPVFAQNKIGATDDTRYAAVPEAVSAADADGLARRGQAAAARGDFERALADLDRACARAPQTARYFLARARVHVAMQQSARALADMDEALRMDPALHDARLARAQLRSGIDDGRSALGDLQALNAALAPSSHLRAGMADVYAHLTLAREALHQWDLWISSHPNDAGLGSALNGRCWLRARLKVDLLRALDDCKRAVEEDDENSSFHDSLGWTHLRVDDPARAIKAFDRAIELRGASAWSYYGRGLTHRRLGNAEGAQRDLMAARKLEPGIDDKVKAAGFDAEGQPMSSPEAASATGSSGS
jgi:predicted aspartyl protease/tetratricopeptide (TPR) repeat protein